MKFRPMSRRSDRGLNSGLILGGADAGNILFGVSSLASDGTV